MARAPGLAGEGLLVVGHLDLKKLLTSQLRWCVALARIAMAHRTAGPG